MSETILTTFEFQITSGTVLRNRLPTSPPPPHQTVTPVSEPTFITSTHNTNSEYATPSVNNKNQTTNIKYIVNFGLRYYGKILSNFLKPCSLQYSYVCSPGSHSITWASGWWRGHYYTFSSPEIYFQKSYINSNLSFLLFKICKSVHHHKIRIKQPTRCNSLSGLLLVVLTQLNMFRASSRPSSGAQQLQ
jgi:hypothetical protein